MLNIKRKFTTALIAIFAALALAAPTPLQKRAGVLWTKTYDEYVNISSIPSQAFE
jgi:hypothetical protein